MVLMGLGWLAYHLTTSFFFAETSSQIASSSSQNAGPASTLVATIRPDQLEQGEEPQADLPLLAAPVAAPQKNKEKSVDRVMANKPVSIPVDTPSPAPAVTKNPQVQNILSKANTLMDSGKTIEARKILSDYLADNFDSDASIPVRDRAVEIGDQTILSPKVYPNDAIASYYSVKTGDNMVNIARKSKVPYQFICRINGIDDPRRLRVGQKIKLVQGPIHLKVVKHELKMYVFLQDVLFAKYDVGLGKNDNTPPGRWMVEDRVRRPLYVDPDTGKVYGPNDKDNPTGGYWLRLKGIEGKTVGRTGFGIHGTTDPDSIGKFMSKGCVRMRNEEVAQVFDMLIPGESDLYTLP
jgi:LysM repeat protein